MKLSQISKEENGQSIELPKMDKRKFADLDKALMHQAPSLLQEWTGQPVEVKGDEVLFKNTARGDESLGSASLNLTTGAFNDFADADFKGHGLIQLHALLKGKTEAESGSILEGKQLPWQSAPAKKVEAKPKNEAMPIHSNADELEQVPEIHPEYGIPDHTWEYKALDGALLFKVLRFDLEDGRKETRPLSYSVKDKKWVWKFPYGVALPLYQGHTIEEGSAILVTEGEKACDAAQAQFPNMKVITSARGANQAHLSDWSVVKGHDVTIVPDNDKAGTEYALAVAGMAYANSATSVRIKRVEDLGWAKGDDLADHKVSDSFLDDCVEVSESYPPEALEPHLVTAASLLPRGEYSRVKKALAKLIEIGVRDLDSMVKEAREAKSPEQELEEVSDELIEPLAEPWPSPVSGKELFNDITSLIHRYVLIDGAKADAVAAWVMFAYMYVRLAISPLLLITSATPRCGKSTLIDVVAGLVPRKLSITNISLAGIYRAIEIYNPTLIFDEADTFLKENFEIQGILNGGHTRSSARVIRIEKGEDGQMELKGFNTYTPKIIGMIGLPKSNALVDRSILVFMERKSSDERKDKMPLDPMEAFTSYRSKLVRWATDNLEKVEFNSELAERGSNDRSHDNWSVLMSVADVAGEEVLEKVKKAYKELGDTDKHVVDANKELLEGLAEVMASKKGKPEGAEDFMPSAQVVTGLTKMQDKFWADIHGGMTQHRLGKLLGAFKIKPVRCRIDGTRLRGFHYSQLKPIFDRYLPTEEEAGNE
jgi:putative DNA primase/helicase